MQYNSTLVYQVIRYLLTELIRFVVCMRYVVVVASMRVDDFVCVHSVDEIEAPSTFEWMSVVVCVWNPLIGC